MNPPHRSRILIVGAATALLLLGSSLAQARGLGMAKGRTHAIKTQIAKRLTHRKLMHVGKVRPSDVRIRTRLIKPAKGQPTLIGSQARKVTWKLKSNILSGTAKSFTPVVPNGGRHTRLGSFLITKMPRGIAPTKATTPKAKTTRTNQMTDRNETVETRNILFDNLFHNTGVRRTFDGRIIW